MRKCEVKGCENPYKARGFCGKHYIRWSKYGDPEKIKALRNQKIIFEEVNGCFECVSYRKDKNGYPNIKRGRKHYLLHRYIYIQCFGEIDKGLVVRHKCDNRACINPEHLELGTFLDNMNDRIVRGRTAKGSQNGQSKLKEREVKQIRTLLKEGKSLGDIANKFNTSKQNICDIKARRSWKHI